MNSDEIITQMVTAFIEKDVRNLLSGAGKAFRPVEPSLKKAKLLVAKVIVNFLNDEELLPPYPQPEDE